VTRWPAVAALALASLAGAADDPNAPLADAKQQLQALRKDDAAQKAATPAGVKLDLPSLNTPDVNPAPSPARPETRANQEKEKARRDWLVDGFNKLERRKPGPTSDAREQGEREDAAKPLDPSDPDYFLRVYERQRAQAEAKQLETGGPDAKISGGSAVDPLASFMKEWLADSPVRDALKDALPSDATSRESATIAAPAEGSHGAAASARASDPRGASSAVATNPFVQALGLPPIDAPRSAEARSAPIDALPPARPANAPAATVYDLPERPKADLKVTLPPPPSEDKKYFPQLKKF